MSITSLPEEIQQYIVLKLDAVDILQCRMVSKYMASLVDTPSVQYKLALCVAAMIDGPSGLSLSERLEKINAYMDLWSHIPFTLLPAVPSSPSQPRDIRIWPSNNGVLPHAIGNELRLLRPSSSVRGVEERTWTLDLNQLDYHFDMCAVDVAQDLLVLSERPRVNNAFRLHLLRLSAGNAPHDHAKLSVLHGPVAQTLFRPCRYIDIAGDIIAWKVCCPEFEVQVWDWKTGTMLWKYSAQLIEVALLDSSHLLLLFPTEHEFRVFSIDQWRQDAREGIQFTPDSFLCALKLPPLSRGILLAPTKSSITFNVSAASPDACPLFAPDPSAALVVFRFTLEMNTQSYHEVFLLAIPLSTILSHCRSSSSSAVVRWTDWGPLGTRILFLDPEGRGTTTWTSALGSKCALVFFSDPPPSVTESPDMHVDVLLLDFHPAAALRGPGDVDKCSSRFVGTRDIGGPGAAGLLPRDAFTTLPFRTTYRSVAIKDTYWPIGFCMTEDGVHFVVEPEMGSGVTIGGFLGFSI